MWGGRGGGVVQLALGTAQWTAPAPGGWTEQALGHAGHLLECAYGGALHCDHLALPLAGRAGGGGGARLDATP